MNAIRSCNEHGFFTTEVYPTCEASGTHVLSSDRRMRLSNFMSGVLRHFLSDAGVELDDQGWTGYDILVESVLNQYSWSTPKQIAGIIATDPKGRYERDAGHVRATYGHSADINLETADTSVPMELYHGTAPAIALDPPDQLMSILGGEEPESHAEASTNGPR